MNDMLYLPLKKRWYEMIERGKKLEEYREITPYWIKRIMKCRKWCGCEADLSRCFQKRCENTLNFCAVSGGLTCVRFSKGYTNTVMQFEIESITIGHGCPEWGAPPDRMVFVIRLGERI